MIKNYVSVWLNKYIIFNYQILVLFIHREICIFENSRLRNTLQSTFQNYNILFHQVIHVLRVNRTFKASFGVGKNVSGLKSNFFGRFSGFSILKFLNR